MIVLGPHPAPTLSTLSTRPSNLQGNPQTSVTFLHINISVQDNNLATSVYYKPTDLHSYLLYSSHVKDPIPYSQFLRLRRLCSDDLDFNSKYDEMSNFFSERGYPYILSKALNHVQNVNRETAVEPSTSNNEERIPFTFFSLSTLTIYPPEARSS